MIRLMKGFPIKDAHKTYLKKTRFWLLIDANVEKKLVSDQCRWFDEVVAK